MDSKLQLADLLKLSTAGSYYLGIMGKSHYMWADNINSLLDSLSLPQKEIIIYNFTTQHKEVKYIIDKLTELLIAHKEISNRPIFFNDTDGNPDIYLNKTKKYIEVKRVNMSDQLREHVNQSAELKESSETIDENTFDNNLTSLLKKSKDHIEKGITQLKGKNGKLIIVYSIDPKILNHEKEYRRKLQNSHRDTEITLELINEKELFTTKDI
ncbi:hypothetical protein ISR92_00830 [Patescibacteria group bacterium]|nr:hypothetical protein [Patescibacteria group bacterium]